MFPSFRETYTWLCTFFLSDNVAPTVKGPGMAKKPELLTSALDTPSPLGAASVKDSWEFVFLLCSHLGDNTIPNSCLLTFINCVCVCGCVCVFFLHITRHLKWYTISLLEGKKNCNTYSSVLHYAFNYIGYMFSLVPCVGYNFYFTSVGLCMCRFAQRLLSACSDGRQF